jgi:Fe-S oxidoreductase/predicted DNA-binding transcriptional regulator YafY
MGRAARLQRIEEMLLASTDGLTIQELATSLSVHRTTIWRDITDLSIDLPIQQIGSRYRIAKDDYLSNIRLNQGESLMLYLAMRRLMRSQTHLPPLMKHALEKLSLALRHPSATQLTASIQVLEAGLPTDHERQQIWEILVQGWVERIVVRVLYQEVHRTVIEVLEVQPYQFEPAVLSNSIYLIGKVGTSGFIRPLNIDHIIKASLTTARFTRPNQAVIESMLRHLWGIQTGQELTQVCLRFRDPSIIDRIRRTIWLPSQRVDENADGSIDLLVAVADVFELVPWIRGWGPDCEVLEPLELQAQILDVQEKHGGFTMATLERKALSFSDEFYASLDEVFDGERIKVCLQCSSCSGICPFGYIMEYHPRKMIAALRAGMFDAVMEDETVWMCVSCYACTQVCPANIPLTAALMTRTKEELLLAGNVPSELQEALENTQRYGNPLGESPRKRADWVQGIDPEIPIMAKAKKPVDVLWFVGDYASYHPRAQLSTKAFAKILQALEINFGILGPEEQSDGDSQRLAGEKGLFEVLAENNSQALAKYQFSQIVTTDPHAFNALLNEYPKLGYSYPVQHYTQFLAERIDQLKPLLKNQVEATITFHDPCYLGRVNNVFDPPRELLRAIPGVELVEMTHTRENSLCCGGGGGGMWLDGFQWEHAHERLSEWRVREAISASGAGQFVMRPPIVETKKKGKKETEAHSNGKVGVLAIACPYEAPRFEDAAKMIEDASKLVVKDIAELLVESMGI